MKQKVRKPSETMKFKEPKVRRTGAYSGRSVWKRLAEWFKDYYRVVIPSFLCAILVIVVIVLLLQKKENNRAAVQEDEAISDSIESEEFVVPDVSLEVDAHDDVNYFVTNYYTAMANGDVDTYISMRDETDDTEKIRMQKKSNYIESYVVNNVYTEPGPVENSYIAFVYFHVKFYDVESLAPGLTTLYLLPRESGELCVGIAAQDERVSDYIETILTRDDVVDVFTMVKVKYAEAVDQDEALKVFLDELSTKLKYDVGTALAQLEAENAGVSDDPDTSGAGEAPVTDPETDNPNEDETVTVTEMVRTNDRVNVRQEPSTSAQKVDTAAKGTVFERLEILDNGWSRIKYSETIEAYIMTSFLEVVADAIGSVTVLENVNVRASASPNATKLGTASKGEVFELIEEVGNGWSKINYNGQTAYIKSEYLRVN